MPNQIKLEEKFTGRVPKITEHCVCSRNKQSKINFEDEGEGLRRVYVECILCGNYANYIYKLNDGGLWMLVDE